jgi:hypothetical protein
MSQVYTFRPSNNSNTNGNVAPKPVVPRGSGSVTGGAYSFKKDQTSSGPDSTKPIEFTAMDFPALGGPKGPVVPAPAAPSCWSNPGIQEIIREPFKVTPLAPRINMPPLFAKATKATKRQFVDEDEDEEMFDDGTMDDYDNGMDMDDEDQYNPNGW